MQRRFVLKNRCPGTAHLLKLSAFLMLLFLSNSCHVGRFVIYNFANISDYKKFPAREINKGTETFQFNSLPQDHPKRLKMPDVKDGNKKVPFETFLKKHKTVAFMVVRRDTILYEEYFSKYDSASIIPSFSMAKSYTSALTGIAVHEGFLTVNDPMTKYITELKGTDFDKITVEDLLNMQSGIAYIENYYNPFGNVAVGYYGTNLLRHVKKLKIGSPPGGRTDYKSIDTQLLGLVVERATGKKLATYLEEKIWKPLGMEFDASWSLDSKKNDTEKAFCCINARVRDFAKFGRLYLNKGNWNGQQIIPEEWVNKTADANGSYAYQWWLQSGNDYAAVGHLGQFIYLHPDEDMILIRMGKNYGGVGWTGVFQKVINHLE